MNCASRARTSGSSPMERITTFLHRPLGSFDNDITLRTAWLPRVEQTSPTPPFPIELTQPRGSPLSPPLILPRITGPSPLTERRFSPSSNRIALLVEHNSRYDRMELHLPPRDYTFPLPLFQLVVWGGLCGGGLLRFSASSRC